MSDSIVRQYLGDGVYAKFDGWMLTIYLDNGVTQSSFIALEPEVLQALVEFNAVCRQLKPENEVDVKAELDTVPLSDCPMCQTSKSIVTASDGRSFCTCCGASSPSV